MSESGSNAVECTIAWSNDTTNLLRIECHGLETQTIEPGRKSPPLRFLAAHNTPLDMVFILDDGTATSCKVKWRTVADKFAITQKSGDDPEFAIPWLIAKTRQDYCISVGRHDSQGGILIVGTLDTK